MKRRAFTLIERLVAIAIMSVLAAILFPVFARARENARRASCMSNLKQIGLGIMQYTQDYDERYPPAFLWDCSTGKPGLYTNSYTKWTPIASAQIGRPAEVVMALDENNSWGNIRAVPLTTPIAEGNTQLTPHLDRGNLVYADGHVKWQQRTKYTTGVAGSCVPASYNVAPYNTYASCNVNWNPFIP